jgi:hypothetical protein
VSADGKSVECTVHGTAGRPRQPLAPAEEGKMLYGAAGISASLTFLEDGLHAVVNVRRK